jgi:hypothetical protein
MNWLKRVLGQTGAAVPWRVTVRYADGSTATINLWARDVRDALKQSEYWVAERDVAITAVETRMVDR